MLKTNELKMILNKLKIKLNHLFNNTPFSKS